MIFGANTFDREHRESDRRARRHRPRRRFALFPVQLTGLWPGDPESGRWLWLEWYELRRYGWGGNTRRRL